MPILYFSGGNEKNEYNVAVMKSTFQNMFYTGVHTLSVNSANYLTKTNFQIEYNS
jgi:hypothetical protein